SKSFSLMLFLRIYHKHSWHKVSKLSQDNPNLSYVLADSHNMIVLLTCTIMQWRKSSLSIRVDASKQAMRMKISLSITKVNLFANNVIYKLKNNGFSS